MPAHSTSWRRQIELVEAFLSSRAYILILGFAKLSLGSCETAEDLEVAFISDTTDRRFGEDHGDIVLRRTHAHQGCYNP